MPPKKKKPLRFTLTAEGQEMIVEYVADYFIGIGHFDFNSPHTPRRRIPISDTGYRSEFAKMDEIEAAGGPQEYARQVVRRLVPPLPLFE